MNCQERKDSMLLLISGALDPAELAELRQHLATGCPVCIGSLAEAEATMHKIPLSLQPKSPPPGAWDKIEMRIALKEQAEGPSTAALTSPSRKLNSATWLGWAAAAAIALTLGIILNNTNNLLHDASEKNTSLTSRLDATDKMFAAKLDENNQMKTRLIDLEQKAKQFDDEKRNLQIAMAKEFENKYHGLLMDIMNAKPIEMDPKALAGVHATLYASDDTWTICAGKVKPCPPGKTYELWIVPKNGNPIAAGTFNPTSDGMALHQAKIPAGIGPIAAAAVTDEPIGGTTAPTGQFQFMTAFKD